MSRAPNPDVHSRSAGIRAPLQHTVDILSERLLYAGAARETAGPGGQRPRLSHRTSPSDANRALKQTLVYQALITPSMAAVQTLAFSLLAVRLATPRSPFALTRFTPNNNQPSN